MKKIEIIPIAKRKAYSREIKEDWIIETILDPQQTVEGYNNRKVAQRIYHIKNKKYLLRVVYEELEGTIFVLTSYLTSKISRYWEE